MPEFTLWCWIPHREYWVDVFRTNATDADEFIEWCMVAGNARTIVHPIFDRKWAIVESA